MVPKTPEIEVEFSTANERLATQLHSKVLEATSQWIASTGIPASIVPTPKGFVFQVENLEYLLSLFDLGRERNLPPRRRVVSELEVKKFPPGGTFDVLLKLVRSLESWLGLEFDVRFAFASNPRLAWECFLSENGCSDVRWAASS
ncbi:MAG: hypothetical protein Kow0069_13150 [Promethearchaeota archaeon]